MNKDEALSVIIEDAFPLFTREVQHFFERVRVERGGPTPCKANIMDLANKYYDHFSGYLYLSTHGDKSKRKEVEQTEDGDEITAAHKALLRKYVEDVYRLRRHMLKLSSDDFHRRYAIAYQNRRAIEDSAAEDFDQAQFYNFPEASANFDHWFSLKSWLGEEAIALSFGKNPDVVSSKTIAEAVGRHPSNFLKHYNERLRCLNRAHLDVAQDGQIEPKEFCRWASSQFDVVPTQFDQSASNRGGDENSDLRKENEELKERLAAYEASFEDMNPKSRRTLYIMILAMAIKNYGHRIDKNSQATSMIVNAADDLGFSIKKNAIKTALEAAASDPYLAEIICHPNDRLAKALGIAKAI